MTTTLATLTVGQTFTITQSGHKFEGRTLRVKAIGQTGRSIMAEDVTKKNNVILMRNTTSVITL